jgi:hypothetical protein
MSAAPAAIFVNPRIAAIIAIIRKAKDQRNILFRFYVIIKFIKQITEVLFRIILELDKNPF